MRLKSSVLSQTGRLLESLRLHKQASPYIAKAIEISTQLKDSVNIFYDAMLLAYIYKHREEYDLARHQLYIAKKFAPDMPIEDKEWWDIEYASILQHEGKNDSSLMIINRLPNITDSLYKNYVFGVTADIYKTTEKIDSAYHYAKKLALSSDFTNRFAGFKILFSPEVFLSIPKDSIAFFARAYGKYIDAYLNRYESQDALYQNSKYNYSIHQRDKEKILKEKIKTEKDLKIAYVVAAGCVLLLLIIVFRLKYNSIKNEILLHRALHLINSLELDNKLNFVHHRNEVNRDVSQNIKRIEYNNQRTTSTHNSSLQDTLRKELLERLQYVSSDHIPEPILDEQIVESLIVKKLHKLLSENKGIKYNDTDLWISIEKEVLKSTPEFKTKLMTLSLGKMNNKEYQVALLIRCGFKPKEISDLIMRGKSAATDRRRFLTKKIFGESGTIRELDRIILRL